MMIKNAFASALLVVLSFVAAAVLYWLGDTYFPAAVDWLSSAGRFAVKTLDVPYKQKAVSTLILAALLAFVWDLGGSLVDMLRSRKR